MASKQELQERAKDREIKNNMTKAELIEIGKLIREERHNLNPPLTQKQLAEKLKIHESTMGAIEQGRRSISLELKNKLISIFGKNIFDTNIFEQLEEPIGAYIKTIDEFDYVIYSLYIKFYKNMFNEKELEKFRKRIKNSKKKLINSGTTTKRINALIKKLIYSIPNIDKSLQKNIENIKKPTDLSTFFDMQPYKNCFEMLNKLDKKSIITNYKIPVFDSVYLDKTNIYMSEVYGSHNINKDLFYDQYDYVGIFLTTPSLNPTLKYISNKYNTGNIITVRLSNYFYNNTDVIISINGIWYIKSICIDNFKVILSNPCSINSDKQEYCREDIKKFNIKIIGTIVDIYFNNTFKYKSIKPYTLQIL